MKVTSCRYCGHPELTYVTHRLDNNGILRCNRCGIMMVENLSDDTEQLYTADYFEKSEGTKNGYTNYLSSPVANLIGKFAFTHLFAKKPGRHLDLGCADGSLMEIFRSEGFESRGLEISKDAVKIAQDKGLDVRFSTLEAFPKDLPKSTAITAFDLLEHASSPRVVLEGAYNNLEDGGYFVFSTLSVKHDDPTDYWYNNSLEHYIYYNHDNLTYALTDIFGAGNFGFVEIEINGVAEFWGFAKKGRVGTEAEVIHRISTGDYDRNNPEAGYLVSLFYNQLSKFSNSEKIIRHFRDEWPTPLTIQAEFYNYYFQGRFEAAVEASKDNRHLVSTQRSIYWQALTHAQAVLFEIQRKDLVSQANSDVIELREQVFQLKGELYHLKSSPLIGGYIKARSLAGRVLRKLRHLAGRARSELREVFRRLIPLSTRRTVRDWLKKYDYRVRLTRTQVVANQPWTAEQPLVSVVIPYYNRADTIDDTLASLHAQTFTNFEVIVVDDGSTDAASIEKLEAIKRADFSGRIIHQKNQGVSAARNTGLKQARGKYTICLDSDDMLDPTFIEKCTVVLETNPDLSLVSTHQDMFGVVNELFRKNPYDPITLYEDNMIITAAQFKRSAWKTTGGYKSGIGYEDWEFWINLAENGYWGQVLPEPLFKYRTSMQSRYVEDKDVHWRNIQAIRSLHSKFKLKVKQLVLKRQYLKQVIDPTSAWVNLGSRADYAQTTGQPNILVTVPWMTFGGAETLIYNYGLEVKDAYAMHFITGLKSEHEWEYKFKEITPNVYHLANLFDDPALYIEFISNYIETRYIDVLHIIHNGFTFDMLPELKRRHPKLKVVVTLFNDRVEYFDQSIKAAAYIDAFSTDNQAVAKHYAEALPDPKPVTVVPNGINCYEKFSTDLFNRETERAKLGLSEDDLAIFFVGRLSEEKNPDVFLKAAKMLLTDEASAKLKFFMIGDGPMRHQVEAMVKVLGENVMYLGYHDQAQVARYLSAADIFVLPSSIEGFPLSILEAMAMRLAVIASAVGAVPDIIESGKTGFVVAPGSAQEIADIIRELHAKPKQLASIKAAARRQVENKYSNTILGENYKQLYRGVIS